MNVWPNFTCGFSHSQLVRDFYFLLLEYFVFFLLFNLILLHSYFIFSNYGNSALMKDVKIKFQDFNLIFISIVLI